MELGSCILFAVSVSAFVQVPPPRDTPAKPAAPATIRGKVTAAATGQALHRVRVTLNGPALNAPIAVTDTRGIFELTDVPPGSYTLTAVRAGYLTVHYGQRRPREAGRTITVKAGETLEGIDVALARGGVLAGRITDEMGDAAPGVRVEALEVRYIKGRRIPVPARIANTNDAGEYRLSGLEPGSYQVRASSSDIWESEDTKSTFAYAATYFPGVTAGDHPESVNVSSGEGLPSIDFRLVQARAARITGVVESANGEAMAAQVVNLDSIGRTIGGALLFAAGAANTRTDARGMFEFPKLAPGEYVAYSGDQANRVAVPIVLTEGDAQHVVLSPRKENALTGSIVTDEGVAPPFPAARVRLAPISIDPQFVLPQWTQPREQTLKPDWTFRITNPHGQYLFRLTGLPSDWRLQSVLLGGRDIADTPMTVSRGDDMLGLQLVLSRKGASLAGEIVDRAGAPAPDTTVIVFPEDTTKWGLASRFVRAVRPDSRGRFSVAAIPPGDYRVVAREYVVESQWEDVEFLQTLLKHALPLRLAEGASETIKLTVAEER